MKALRSAVAEPAPHHQARIVVGCDGTQEDDAALYFAVQEARAHHATLLVVSTGQGSTAGTEGSDAAELNDQARARVRAAMSRAFVRSRWPRDYVVIVAGRDEIQTLLDAAGSAVMIVIGGHHRYLRQRLLGRLNSVRGPYDGPVAVTVVSAADVT